MKSNIYLTGFSATGKTTTGRKLGEILDMTFVDLDSVIERCCGKKIPNIFLEYGEEHFRFLEAKCLGVVASENNQVVSTGGGLPVRLENREVMFATGTVVCLQADPAVILDRLVSQERSEGEKAYRPMLDSPQPLIKIKELLKLRAQIYAACQIVIATDNKSPQMVADEIIKGLNL